MKSGAAVTPCLEKAGNMFGGSRITDFTNTHSSRHRLGTKTAENGVVRCFLFGHSDDPWCWRFLQKCTKITPWVKVQFNTLRVPISILISFF